MIFELSSPISSQRNLFSGSIYGINIMQDKRILRIESLICSLIDMNILNDLFEQYTRSTILFEIYQNSLPQFLVTIRGIDLIVRIDITTQCVNFEFQNCTHDAISIFMKTFMRNEISQ